MGFTSKNATVCNYMKKIKIKKHRAPLSTRTVNLVPTLGTEEVHVSLCSVGSYRPKSNMFLAQKRAYGAEAEVHHLCSPRESDFFFPDAEKVRRPSGLSRSRVSNTGRVFQVDSEPTLYPTNLRNFATVRTSYL